MRKEYSPFPHYYLQKIGVRLDFQGQGFSSRLIMPFVDEAERRGFACYTETVTPTNVSLFDYFGFEVVEQFGQAIQ